MSDKVIATIAIPEELRKRHRALFNLYRQFIDAKIPADAVERQLTIDSNAMALLVCDAIVNPDAFVGVTNDDSEALRLKAFAQGIGMLLAQNFCCVIHLSLEVSRIAQLLVGETMMQVQKAKPAGGDNLETCTPAGMA